MLSFRDQISWGDYLTAFLAGLSLVFAFQPFGWIFFAWLVPAVLFWLNLKPMLRWQRIRLAWVFGIGMFAGGTHWIFYSIFFFGGGSSFFAGLITTAFIVIIALMLMLFGWLVSLFPYQIPSVKLLLIFPALWTLTEWFRGWFLTGFPWLQLGQSQTDTWLAAYAPIIGSLGVGYIVALGAGALVLVFTGKTLEKVLAGAVMLATVAAGVMLDRLQWTHPEGEPIYVSLIQANILQQEKWVSGLRNVHIQKHIDLMEPHIMNSDLLIWPETAIPDTFQQTMNELIVPMQDAMKTAGTELLTGGFHYDQASGAVYNAAMVIGENLDVYGKRHLVPFSEYFPFLEYLRWLNRFVDLPYDSVNPWKGSVNLTLAGQPMRISICYEDAYGEEMIEGLPEASMLVNLSNDGWFTGSIEAQQHVQIARFRAIETGRYLLRATNNGVSAIFDEKGRAIATAPQYEAAIIAAFAQPMRGSTLYVFWGNWFLISLLILLSWSVWWISRGKFR